MESNNQSEYLQPKTKADIGSEKDHVYEDISCASVSSSPPFRKLWRYNRSKSESVFPGSLENSVNLVNFGEPTKSSKKTRERKSWHNELQGTELRVFEETGSQTPCKIEYKVENKNGLSKSTISLVETFEKRKILAAAADVIRESENLLPLPERKETTSAFSSASRRLTKSCGIKLLLLSIVIIIGIIGIIGMAIIYHRQENIMLELEKKSSVDYERVLKTNESSPY